MRFESHQIRGRGRATTLGFPTINLEIPKGLKLDYGIYGVNLYVDKDKYLGAMHYGPSPTFKDALESCEVYLLDVDGTKLPVTDGKEIKIDILRFIRGVMKFDTTGELIGQIEKDVEEIRKLSET